MSYMDQTMSCKVCGHEHTQFSTGICYSCEREAAEQKRKAEWDAKTPLEQAMHHLEKWADPTAYTFDKDTAKFVFNTLKKAMLDSRAHPPITHKDYNDVPIPGHWFAGWPDSQKRGYFTGYRKAVEDMEKNAVPVAWRLEHGEFTHYSGARVHPRDELYHYAPDPTSRYYEGCTDLKITPLFNTPQSAPGMVVVGELVEIDDGFGKQPNSILSIWNEERDKLPGGTLLYAVKTEKK